MLPALIAVTLQVIDAFGASGRGLRDTCPGGLVPGSADRLPARSTAWCAPRRIQKSGAATAGAADPDSSRVIYVASPEDTILAKLEWYRLGGEISDRQWRDQWRDILGALAVQGDRLDRSYMCQWVVTLDVSDLSSALWPRLGGVRLIPEKLPGTAIPQYVRCGRPHCRCAQNAHHGPYYFCFWRGEANRSRKEYMRPADLEVVWAAGAARHAGGGAVLPLRQGRLAAWRPRSERAFRSVSRPVGNSQV
jgi:Family of unknown function (DUF6788)